MMTKLTLNDPHDAYSDLNRSSKTIFLRRDWYLQTLDRQPACYYCRHLSLYNTEVVWLIVHLNLSRLNLVIGGTLVFEIWRLPGSPLITSLAGGLLYAPRIHICVTDLI